MPELNDEGWSIFFELLEEITRLEMTWREKAELVLAKAKECNSADEFNEFLEWFDVGSFKE